MLLASDWLLELTRTPSMTRSGSFERETELAPRMRTRAPEPVVPPLWAMVTHAARPGVSEAKLLIADSGVVLSLTLILATVLPLSRRRDCSPDAVTTTCSSWVAERLRTNWTFSVEPAVTEMVWMPDEYPIRRTRSCCWPTGTPEIRNWPASLVAVPSVDDRKTWAPGRGWRESRSITVPVTIPVPCAANDAGAASARIDSSTWSHVETRFIRSSSTHLGKMVVLRSRRAGWATSRSG